MLLNEHSVNILSTDYYVFEHFHSPSLDAKKKIVNGTINVNCTIINNFSNEISQVVFEIPYFNSITFSY